MRGVDGSCLLSHHVYMIHRYEPLSKRPPDVVKAALCLFVLAGGGQLRGRDDGRRLWQLPLDH